MYGGHAEEAVPYSYGASDWATPQSSQQDWSEQAAWNTPQQPSQTAWNVSQQDLQQAWNIPPQNEQPAWGSQQQGWQQAQPEQQWGWSIPPEGQQSWAVPQQQGWQQQLHENVEQPATDSQPEQLGAQMGLVPYQGGMELQAASSRTSMLHLLSSDLAEKMLPAIPQEDLAIYVPPMYTKPRAIIPRYRAISGLLSMLIVGILLCTGAGYAAKATGTLDTLTRIVTGESHPAPIQRQTANNLPDPKTQSDKGPAYGIIYSATTTSRVDPTTGLPVQEEHSFQTDSVIHLTYAVKSDKAGTVQIQWYSNGNALTDPIMAPFDPKDGQNKHADAQISYHLPAEGWVELRWNNQLAMRLYFVVRGK
jgi:hypothetical protein